MIKMLLVSGNASSSLLALLPPTPPKDGLPDDAEEVEEEEVEEACERNSFTNGSLYRWWLADAQITPPVCR
jgi:hypothetical protein